MCGVCATGRMIDAGSRAPASGSFSTGADPRGIWGDIYIHTHARLIGARHGVRLVAGIFRY